MNNILTITEDNIMRFDYDIVTHANYNIGDRVVKCHSCHAIIKVDYVSDGCPICGARPFVSDSLDIVHHPHITHRPLRAFWSFVSLLCLSVLASLLPLRIPPLFHFISQSLSGLDIYLCAVIIAAISALLLLSIPKSRRVWRYEKAGWLFALIPAVAPYALLLTIWCVLGLVGLCICFAYLAICIAIVAGIIFMLSGG